MMTTNQTKQNDSAADQLDWAAIDPALADDRTVFSAGRVRELIAAALNTTPVQPAVANDADALKRLRRVLAMLGLGKAMPDDDAALAGSLFSVFGMIADALERREAFALPAHVAAMEEFRKFANQQGYPLTTCVEMDTIFTANGLAPATFYHDRTEHAWRGWANRPGAEEYRDRAHSAERACYRAGLLFDTATREWQPPVVSNPKGRAAIYQVATRISNGVVWADVDRETFDFRTRNSRTRVVYEHVPEHDAPGADTATTGTGDVKPLAPRHLRTLRFAQMASCSCLTKTPDIQYHKDNCRYRNFAEIERYLANQTRSSAQDILSWARENKNLLTEQEFTAINAAVHRFLASHGISIADPAYNDDTLKAASATGLLESDTFAVAGSSRASADVWEPGAGEDIPACVDNALVRAVFLLLSNRNSVDYLYASRLEFLRQNVVNLLAIRSGEPDVALLSSMATCLNHGFGMLPARQQISMLDDMRKLYDEVTGKGYYRPSNRGRYTQYLSTDVEGGERTWAGLDASTPSSSADANKDDPQ